MTTEISAAEYLIALNDGATALCESHAQAFEHIMYAAGHQAQIYRIDPDEPPIVCQACHLADLRGPRIILPH